MICHRRVFGQIPETSSTCDTLHPLQKFSGEMSDEKRPSWGRPFRWIAKTAYLLMPSFFMWSFDMPSFDIVPFDMALPVEPEGVLPLVSVAPAGGARLRDIFARGTKCIVLARQSEGN